MRRLLTSCFGLGWLPIAPGTWGSVPVALIFAVLSLLSTPPAITAVVMVILGLAGSVVCVRFAPEIIASTGKNDPGEVVADEFAGETITFLIICFVKTDSVDNYEICVISILGFLLFRFFDILKPWPIRKLEKLPKGWGILADDLLAGIYAGTVLLLCQINGLPAYITSVILR
ncbi:MAG: phosphatidylglycerophosphatase A family protein [Planctomycetota bacterium]|jgi:phosphatidylglycerophosphatase A